jgi:hypothetical protein
MTTRTVDLLDSAIGTVKAARDHLRHDNDLLPSDLSGVIGTLREVVWTIDTFTATIIDAYGRQHCLGHDDGHNATAAVAHVVERLDQVRRLLDGIDGSLGDAHNTAAKLHER